MSEINAAARNDGLCLSYRVPNLDAYISIIATVINNIIYYVVLHVVRKRYGREKSVVHITTRRA